MAPLFLLLNRMVLSEYVGDYKLTINWASQTEHYPLRQLFTALSGGKCFTKLVRFSQAYLQLELEKDSNQYVTINTSKGLNQYRLPFGVSFAPAIFQDNFLQRFQQVSM